MKSPFACTSSKMGCKILGLQLMRSFFQFMGNHSCPFARAMEGTRKTRRRSSNSIKVIRSDGMVLIHEQPILVSELTLKFPKHMVCSSDAFYIGQKIPALSEKDELQPGHTYFLLPNHLFHSVLSFVTITSIISSSSQSQSQDNHLKKALVSCQPFHIQKTQSGNLRVNVSEDFISLLMMEHQETNNINDRRREGLVEVQHRLCTTRQLQKDYAHLVPPTRQWKPKLDTIKERRDNRRKMASASAYAMKRNNRKKTQKSRGLLRHSSSSSPSVSHKITCHNKIKAFLATRRG